MTSIITELITCLFRGPLKHGSGPGLGFYRVV